MIILLVGGRGIYNKDISHLIIMKLFKTSKLIMATAIALGLASVVGIGVGAYIITGGNKTAEVPVTDDDIVITNNVVNLTASLKSDDNKLVYEPTEAVTGKRLNSDGNGDLDVTLVLSVEATSTNIIPTFTVSVVSSYDAKSPELTALNTYLVKPSDVTVNNTEFTGPSPYTKEVKLTWAWGSAFNTTDPCTYYNKKSEEEVSTATLVSEMESFRDNVNGNTWKIEINPVE